MYHIIFMQHIQKYGSAFLNSDGGTLCVGVSDEGYATYPTIGCTCTCTYYILVTWQVPYSSV